MTDEEKKKKRPPEGYNPQNPGEYKSQYQGQIDQLTGQIQNRVPFRFDPSTNPMYGTMRDQYMQMGRNAMTNTMGAAAGLTGGYGSSYGQAVGQQAYNDQIRRFNADVVPGMYRSALDQYNAEGNRMLQNLQLLQSQENQAYGRHMDSLNQYLAQVDRDREQARYEEQLKIDQDRYDRDEAFRREQFEYQKERGDARGSGGGGGRGYGGYGGGGGGEYSEESTDTMDWLISEWVNNGGTVDGFAKYMKENGYGDRMEDALKALIYLLENPKQVKPKQENPKFSPPGKPGKPNTWYNTLL